MPKDKPPFTLYLVKDTYEAVAGGEPFITDQQDKDYAIIATYTSSIGVDRGLLANFLDEEAENDNYHDLVGSYTGLANLLGALMSQGAVTEVLWNIARLGGYQGLVGFPWGKP